VICELARDRVSTLYIALLAHGLGSVSYLDR
jgi:hypothetical protein